MVAIVAGNGLGLLNTSLNILGGAGVLGQSALGQGTGRAFVNAASGNLLLLMQDEQLAGRGLNLYALRAYNSLGTPNDGDGDDWRWGYEQTVRFQGQGTPAQPQAGASCDIAQQPNAQTFPKGRSGASEPDVLMCEKLIVI